MVQDYGIDDKQYLLMSDFDQTLSFNDSGFVLSELLGVGGFHERVAGLSKIHLVQQGGELAYLLLHDPEFRHVRKEHLVKAGQSIRLKENIQLLSQLLRDLDGYHFSFYVVSAAPEEVIRSALDGIVPEDHIFGTRFRYDSDSGEIQSIDYLRAGYGKVAILDELRGKMAISHNRLVYVGDGSSDVHVMLHVNRLEGLTIAVSENKYITQIAKRTILSDDALSVLVPILEDIVGWDARRIRALFEAYGFVLQDWDKVRTDSLTISRTGVLPMDAVGNSDVGGGLNRGRADLRVAWPIESLLNGQRCTIKRFCFASRPSGLADRGQIVQFSAAATSTCS